MSTYDPYASNTYPQQGAGMSKQAKIYLVGGGVGLIAIWFYIKRKNANSAASTDTTSTDASATDASATDSGYSPALTSYTDPSTGTIIAGGGWGAGGYPLPGTTITEPGNNGMWAQQAEAMLIQIGYDPVATATALGLYLANKNLTDDQLAIVQTAIGFEGPPPTPVNPPHTAPPPGQTSGGGVTGGTGSEPREPSDLHIVSKHKGAAVLGWHPMPSAQAYWVYYNGHRITLTPRANVTVHRDGEYAIASVRGRYVSPKASIKVEGI